MSTRILVSILCAIAFSLPTYVDAAKCKLTKEKRSYCRAQKPRLTKTQCRVHWCDSQQNTPPVIDTLPVIDECNLTKEQRKYCRTQKPRLTSKQCKAHWCDHENLPPIVEAGNDQAVSLIDSVTLNGSATDPEGGTLVVKWTQTKGANVVLSNKEDTTATFTAPSKAGRLVFKLTAADSWGATGSDEVYITVNKKDPITTNIHGKSYYIDSNTSNLDNDGLSIGSPFKGLWQLDESSIKAGDTIYIKRGSEFNHGFVFSFSGTKSKPITITHYGSEGKLPVFRNPVPYNGSAFTVKADNIVVDGLRFEDAKRAGIYLKGANNCVIKNSESTNVGLGIRIEGNNNLITGNYIHDLNMIVNDKKKDNDWGAVGIWINKGENTEISYNRIIRCRAPSFDYGFDGGAIESWEDVTGLKIHHNYAKNNDGFFEFGSPGDSVKKNVDIYYNLCINNEYYFMSVHNSGNFNASYENIQIRNNTVIERQKVPETRYTILGFKVNPKDKTEFTLVNNIFVSNDVWFFTNTNNFTHSHNIFHFEQNHSEPGFKLDPTDMIADPRFVDIDKENFNLRKDSPAIDSGKHIDYKVDYAQTAIPKNHVPDIGAFEFTGTLSGIDNIISINGPASIGKGQTVQISIDVSAPHRRKVMVALLDKNNNRAYYGGGNILVDTGESRVNVSVTVDDNAPVHSNYIWLAVITTVDGDWKNKFDNKTVSGVSVTPSFAANDAVNSVVVPRSINQGSSSIVTVD